MDKEEIVEKGMTKRDALNFLIVDETEAISGYDKVMKACDWDESDRIELERIRNAEIDHISDLSKLLNKHSTTKIVGTDSVDPDAISTEGEQPVQDDRPTVKWQMHQAPEGYFYFKSPDGETFKENGVEVRFASKLPAGEFFVTHLFNRGLWGNEVPKVIKDAQAPGRVIKTDGGWAVTADRGFWLMYSPNGYIKFSTTIPSDRTVFPTQQKAEEIAREYLAETYGIKDSTPLKDYSARGSFNTIGELRSHYPGAGLRLKNGGLTVILKSGAELDYSYIDDGRLVFIRGRN